MVQKLDFWGGKEGEDRGIKVDNNSRVREGRVFEISTETEREMERLFVEKSVSRMVEG